jgi:flagellar biosynthetic protein FlhB
VSSRTLAPTARRLARARRDGDHPISLAVTRLAGTICAAALVPLSGASLVRQTRELLTAALQPGAAPATASFESRLVWLVLPVLGAVGAFSVALGVWQTGGTLSTAPLGWSWQRLNPLSAFDRGAALTRVWAATALVLSAGLFAALAIGLIGSIGAELAASIGDLERTALLAAELCQRLLWWAVAVGLAVAVLDALVQRRAWLDRHRMTREELVRELREAEGDPALRHERREAHRTLLDATQLSRMPGATLVVLDWPQLAVALRYDPERDAAPVVLFQAVGPAASSVRTAAEIYDVVLHDDPSLARRLAQLPIDTAIPGSLFTAVAAALEPWALARGGRQRDDLRSGRDTSA